MKKSLLYYIITKMNKIFLIFLMTIYVGMTFAWFDSVSAASINTIKAGFVDIEIMDENGKSLEDKIIHFNNSKYFEPGISKDLETIYIENKGNLPCKYYIEIVTEDNKLLEVIEWKLNGGELKQEFTLQPHEKSGPIKINAHMQEKAGNEYQNLTLTGIKVNVIAKQEI